MSIFLCAPLFTFCQSASEKVSGSYEAIINTGNSPGRILQLELGDDRTAAFDIDYLDKEGSITQKGSWERSGKDSLTVYFIDKNGQLALDTLRFGIQGSQLVLTGGDYAEGEIVLLRRDR